MDSVQTAARKGNKTTTAPKILPLTSLRFFAAYMVVIQHTVDQPAHTYNLRWWGKFLNMGYELLFLRDACPPAHPAVLYESFAGIDGNQLDGTVGL